MPLFDFEPVSQSDIEYWLDQIPNLSHSQWRRDQYAKSYNVVEKIERAKSEGRWPLKTPNSKHR